MAIDINKLERLAAQATSGPWVVAHLCTNTKFVFAQAPDCDMVFHAREEDVQYITEVCNTVPELIAENRDLQKRVQELEKQRNWLAQKHANACIDAACDACTSHIGDCPICPLPQGTGLCIEVSEVTFINAAEQAAKED